MSSFALWRSRSRRPAPVRSARTRTSRLARRWLAVVAVVAVVNLVAVTSPGHCSIPHVPHGCAASARILGEGDGDADPPLAWERLAQAGGAPTAIAVEGRVAVLGVAESVWLVDLTVDNRPRVIGRTPLLGATVVDIAISGRLAVVALGADGLAVIDIADPTAPVVLEPIAGEARTLAAAGDRVVACGGAGCRVLRIAGGEAPEVVGTVAFAGEVGPVAAGGPHAYVAVDASIEGGGITLYVIDIADPAGPQTVQTKSLVASPVRGLGLAGDWLYVIQDSGDLRAYDLSGEGPPVPRGGVRIPAGVQAVGAHPLAVALDRVYVASGLEVSAVDVTQPTAPRFLGATPVDGLIAALSATPSRLYVANHADLVGERRAFHGLEVLASAVDGAPRSLGALDEAWHGYGVALMGGRYAVVAAGRSGLRIVDVRSAGGPREIANWSAAAELVDVVTVGDVAYAADASTGAMVHLIDLSEPLMPRAIGALREPGPRASALVRIGHFVAVGLEPRQLVLLDVTDPRAPRRVGQADLPGATLDLAAAGSTLYVLTGRPARAPSLVSLTVGDDGALSNLETTPLDLPLDERALFGLSVAGDTVLVGAGGVLVSIDRAAQPPVELDRLSLPHPAVAVTSGGSRAIVAGGGLSLVDIADPTSLRLLATTLWSAGWPEARNRVVAEGDIAVAAQWDAGLSIARLSEPAWDPAIPPETSTPTSPTVEAPTPTPSPSVTDDGLAATATATSAATATFDATGPAPTASPTDAPTERIATPTAGAPSATAAPRTATPRPTPSSTVTPTARRSPTPSPTRRASATARPSAAAGAPMTVYLPVLMSESCPPRDVFSDVALVIDASTSMAALTPTGQQKIDAALDAVWTFLDGLRLQGAGDRAAIVTFNSEAQVLQELTGDRRKLVSALRRVTLSPRSRVDAGIHAAAAELTAHGRPSAVRAMIVLSDGKANPVTPSAVIAAAQAARRMAFGVFVVGIGPDMDAPTLKAMAGVANRYFAAPDPDQLRPIYAQLVRTVPCPASGYWGRR